MGGCVKWVSDHILTKATLACLNEYELPPTLPQLLLCCRQIRKQQDFYVAEKYVPSDPKIVASCLQKCRETLKEI